MTTALLPAGFHDRLPPLADAAARLEACVLGTAFAHGYERVDPALAELAALHLPAVALAERRFAAACKGRTVCPLMHGDGYVVNTLRFNRPETLLPPSLYGVRVRFAPNDAASDDRVVDVRSRAPTPAESWLTRGGNAYAFISGTVTSARPIDVQPGTTIDIWFPFVLNPSLRYSLTIGVTKGASVGPVDGMLDKNTLQFVMPAFALEPGAELMLEIDSDVGG